MHQIPSALESEAGVLGQIIAFPKSIENVIDRLTPDHFYGPANAIIFKCCKWLYDNKHPIDIITVVQALKKNGYLDSIGGASAVSNLTTRIMGSDSIEYLTEILIKKKTQRDVIMLSTELMSEAYSDSCEIFEVLDKHEKRIIQMSDPLVTSEITSTADLHKLFLEKNIQILKSEGKTGIMSGFTGIDSLTGGWQSPDLIILAGRPSMGKSALASQFVVNPALQGIPTAMFSLEMKKLQLYSRMVSQYSGIASEKINRKGLQEFELAQLHENLIKTNSNINNAPFYIEDNPGINTNEFRKKAKKLVREQGVKLIVIDYLQLMTGDQNYKGNREQEISHISRSLKTTAMELDVPIIALSQMSREIEGRGAGKIIPQLSDLRGSGAIEQDADMVIFVHRPEYYGISEIPNGKPARGYAQVMIKKHRAGPLADIDIHFHHSQVKFSDSQSLIGSSQIFNNYPVGF